MKRKVYAQFNSPVDAGELNPLDSLTDQLADESLQDIVRRFLVSGTIPPQSNNADLQLTDKTSLADVDACFDDFATEDVSRLDKVDALDALATAQRLVEQLRKEQAQKPKQAPIRPQGALEEKQAYTETKEEQKPLE